MLTFTAEHHETYMPHKIVSASVTTDGELHIVRKYPSNMSYCNGTPVPDRVVKEVYRCEGGKIVLAETVVGTHHPAKRIEERIEF